MITISIGIKGLLLFFYLIIETLFIRHRRRSLILSLIPYIIMVRTVNKSLPIGWRVSGVFYHFFFVYRSNGNYCVKVDAKSKLLQSMKYEFIYFNYFGKIIEEFRERLDSLIFFCERVNSMHPDLIRDAKLKKLGI